MAYPEESRRTTCPHCGKFNRFNKEILDSGTLVCRNCKKPYDTPPGGGDSEGENAPVGKMSKKTDALLNKIKRSL